MIPRSERMPAILAPSAETTRAPTRSLRMRCRASETVTSGAMVQTSRPLLARMCSTFIGQPSRRKWALGLRLGTGLLPELAQGVAHALEHGVLAAGHVLALGCRQPQRVLPPVLQDRVLLISGEVLTCQDLLGLTEDRVRIVQRLFVLGHDRSSPCPCRKDREPLHLLFDSESALVALGAIDLSSGEAFPEDVERLRRPPSGVGHALVATATKRSAAQADRHRHRQDGQDREGSETSRELAHGVIS